MLAVAVRGEDVSGGERIRAAPGAIVANVDPDPTLLDGSRFARGPRNPRIEHPDRRVVGVQPVRAHHLRPDPLAKRPEGRDRLATPVDQGRAADVGAVPGENLALAVQRYMVIALRHQDVGEQAGSGHAARYRPAGR